MTVFSSKWLFRGILILVLLVAYWLRVENIQQFPPAISNDEAVNVVDILHISTTGNFPIYQDFGRPEPLYRIFQSVGAFFYGSYVILDRHVSALFGILTLSALYWAVTQCLSDVSPRIRYISALIAVITLTIALGHITLSRALYRGIMQPFFMLLCLGFVMRGLHTYRWRDFMLSGVFLSLSIYSYTSALLVPLAFIPMGLSLLMFRFRHIKTWFPRLLLVGLTTFILTLPISYRLVTQTVSIIGRATDVSSRSIDLSLAYTGMANQLLVSGDENPQYNVNSEPIIPFAVQSLFFLGLLGLLWRIRQPATLYLASLIIICSIPAIASDELTHGLRIVGWFAVFPVIIAGGIASILWLSEKVLPQKVFTSLTIGIIFFLAIFLGVNSLQARETYRQYWLNADNYIKWSVYDQELTHNEWFFRTDRRAFADWILSQNTPLLIPIEELNLPTTRAWLASRYTAVTTASADFVIPTNTQIVIPYALEEKGLRTKANQFALLDNGRITILPPLNTSYFQDLVAQIVNSPTHTTLTHTGTIDFLGYADELKTPLQYEDYHVISPIRFENEMTINGWYGSDTLSNSEQQLTFTLNWSPLQARLGHEYFSYLQIQTQDYQKITGNDQHILRWLYPSSIWKNGDIVPESYRLTIPPLDFGAYRLVTGIYPIFGNTLNTYDGNNTLIGDSATIAWLKVPLNDTTQPANDAISITATFNNAFNLQFAQIEARDNGQYRVDLFWQSLVQRPAIDGTIFVHARNANGELVAQSDQRPYNGQYPTFIWDKDETLHTEHILDLSNQSLEELTLTVGIYTFPDIKNLPAIQKGVEQANGIIELGKVADLLGKSLDNTTP